MKRKQKTQNRRPSMINVGAKKPTHRTATARAVVSLPAALLPYVSGEDIVTRKGSVFSMAATAGILAAKKTSELIPLCHPIAIEDCRIEIRITRRKEAVVECRTEAHDKTGVEMEAMIGAATAALTIYDMCKGLSHDIVIKEVRLLEKRGGKSDYRA